VRLGINGRFYRAGVTGVQRFAREVTARLAGMADVTILLPRNVEPPALPDHVRIERGRMRGHAWEQLELPFMAQAAGCDITLHLSGTAPMRGGPFVIAVHDVLPLTHPHWFSRRFARWYSAVLRHAIPRAAAVVTVSEWSRREIARALGEPRRIHVVTQGLEPFVLPAPREDVERVRSAWQLPPHWLLAVGRGDPRKNLAFLGDVVAELRRRGNDTTLVVTGNALPRVHGPCPDPDGPGVRLIGYVSDADLRALYTGASALCFPSLVEGFGRPPLEAAACGAPALVADLPALPESARPAGLAVPLEAAAWADAIDRLTTDHDFRADMVERGRAIAPGMSWETCAAQVLEACASANDASLVVRTGTPAATL
jgi:glycosyltransferase involved in cell wall biosynthesis